MAGLNLLKYPAPQSAVGDGVVASLGARGGALVLTVSIFRRQTFQPQTSQQVKQILQVAVRPRGRRLLQPDFTFAEKAWS